MKKLILLLLLIQTGMIEVLSQQLPNTGVIVFGKLYYQSKGSKYPASYKRIVVMPRTDANLTKAQDLYEQFDDSTIHSINSARTITTDAEGKYQIRGLRSGNYIIRVTGMGGMVIKFSVSTNNTTTLKIPDMPADYYTRRFPANVYVRNN